MNNNQKLISNIAVLIALLVSIGIVAYDTIFHIPADLFWTSMLTLILGKYFQQAGFTQGVEAANSTAASLSTNNSVDQSSNQTDQKKVPVTNSVTGTVNGSNQNSR